MALFVLAVFVDGAGEKEVLAEGGGNPQSISSGSVQIPRNVTVALLFSQVYRQAAPGVTHIQPRPCPVQHDKRVQEAFPSCVVHRSGKGGRVGAVGFCSVEQQQLCHLGAAHHHDLDWAPPEAVQGVGICAGFQELPHRLHLPPRRGGGQARVTAAAQHALVPGLWQKWSFAGREIATAWSLSGSSPLETQ